MIVDYPALPRFISNDTAVPAWMEGTIGKTRVTVKASHRKKINGLGVFGSTVKVQTFEVRVLATDIAARDENAPPLEHTTIADWGETAANYSIGGKTMARLIYEDLHPANGKWAGSITARERAFSGTITMGRKYNLANSKPAHAAMGALAQQINGTVSSGFIEYQIRVGPNPALTVDSIAGRVRAARQNFITTRLLVSKTGLAQPLVELPDATASQIPDEGAAQHSEQVSIVPNGANFDRGIITTLPAAGGTPDPGIILDRVSPTAVRQTTVPAIELRSSQVAANDALNAGGTGANVLVKFRAWTVLLAGGAKKISVAASEDVDLSSVTGGGYSGTYDHNRSYKVGEIVRVESRAVVGGVAPSLGVFGCVVPVAAGGMGNQVPQYPEPAGTVYWHLLTLPIQATQVCQGGGKTVLINASEPY